MIDEIYYMFAEQWLTWGKNKGMTIDEFNDLIISADLIDENLGAREIGQIFNLSIQTYVDEINKDSHLHMKIIEFWEGLAWLSDRFDLKTKQKLPLEVVHEDLILDETLINIKLERMIWFLAYKFIKQEKVRYLFNQQTSSIKKNFRVVLRIETKEDGFESPERY